MNNALYSCDGKRKLTALSRAETKFGLETRRFSTTNTFFSKTLQGFLRLNRFFIESPKRQEDAMAYTASQNPKTGTTYMAAALSQR